MTWRLQCNLYGTGEPVWFVVRTIYKDREQFVRNGHGRPMPFRAEADAQRVCDNLNANGATELLLDGDRGQVTFA
jgi:hypothetical protein